MPSSHPSSTSKLRLSAIAADIQTALPIPKTGGSTHSRRPSGRVDAGVVRRGSGRLSIASGSRGHRRTSSGHSSNSNGGDIPAGGAHAYDADRTLLCNVPFAWSYDKARSKKDRHSSGSSGSAPKMMSLAESLEDTPEAVMRVLQKYAVPKSDRPSNALSSALWQRGVSVAFVLWFTARYKLWKWKTWQVVKYCIVPMTASGGGDRSRGSSGGSGSSRGSGSRSRKGTASAPSMRFIEDPAVQSFVGHGDVYVSHPWGGVWGDLVAALAHGMPLDKTVVIDVFALSQHVKDSSAKRERDRMFEMMDECIANVRQGMMVVCNPAESAESVASAATSNTSSSSSSRRLSFRKSKSRDDKSKSKSSKKSSKSSSVDGGAMAAATFRRTWCLFEMVMCVGLERPLLVQLGRASSSDKGTFVVHTTNNVDKLVTELLGTDGILASRALGKGDKDMLMQELERRNTVEFMNILFTKQLQSSVSLTKFPAYLHAMLGNAAALAVAGKQIVKPERDTGRTLIHHLARLGYGDILDDLLCSLSATDPGVLDMLDLKGNTPMIDAALEGQVETMTVLLNHGASRLITSREGMTPLQIAVETAVPEKVALIRRTFMSSQSSRSVRLTSVAE